MQNSDGLDQIVSLLQRKDWSQFGKVENFSSSGKGGQRKNRVRTAIRLTCPITQKTVKLGRHRKTKRNLEEAIYLLKLKIVLDS